MGQKIYTFLLNLDWKLINEISQIDRFGGSWEAIERREGQRTLKELKSIATVRSVGASTRIEGSKMTDDEVAVLIKNLEVGKLEERDQQEVIGYFETLDLISESFRDIDVTEGNIKHLHNVLMRHSQKDEWHKGNYKQQSNVVEAIKPDGSTYVVFQTTEPGFPTEEAMKSLFEWYNSDNETHPIARSALFVYDFLSIHPFQDGNGRLSRLLATLLLLKHGYSWIQYVSFEHEIESRKAEYYQVLMECQMQRPGENIQSWVIFFLDCLKNIQELLLQKLESKAREAQLSPKIKKLYDFIESHPGTQSGEIAGKLEIPLPTVKKMLSDMLANKLLFKHGTGAGTNYTIRTITRVKKDLVFKLTTEERKRNFTLMHQSEFLELKKIILTPLFKWIRPDEWNSKLVSQGLQLKITCINSKGAEFSQTYSVSSYNSAYYFQPVFTLGSPITIPESLIERIPSGEFPLKVSIEILSSVEKFDFEIMVVYDSALD